MRHLRIFASEFGDAPYACALRYNGLLQSIFNRESPLKISMVTSHGNYKDETKRLTRFWSLGLNCREGRYPIRIAKELAFAFFSLASLPLDRNKIVLISVPNFLSSILICLGCQIGRIPYSIDVRDLYPDSYELGGVLSKNSLLYRYLYKIVLYQYLRAQCLFVATEGLGEMLEARGIPEDKIVAIKNGYHTDFCAEALSSFEHVGRDIVFHGTLGKMQNVDFLSKLVSTLPEFKFTFIGEGKAFDYLKGKNFHNLLIMELMPYRDVLKVVAGHQIGLCIRTGSWYDKVSLPVKIFEYLGLNLSVIGFPETEFSRDPNLRNLLIEFNDFDVDVISKKIRELLESDDHMLREVPTYLTREYQSSLFRDQLLKICKET